MDDIDSFLIAHRNKLQTDKDNLNLPINRVLNNNQILNNIKHEKPTKISNKIPDENEFQNNNNGNRSKSAIMDFLQLNNNNAIEPLKTTTTTVGDGVGCVPENQQLMQSPATATTPRKMENMCSMNTSSMATNTSQPLVLSLPAIKQTRQINETPREIMVEANNFQICDNLGSRNYFKLKQHDSTNCADKTVKNLTNLNERQCAAAAGDSTNQKVVATTKYRVNKDDMEQWVSDTFYSYFPGFNNENKKRQDLLQDRQLEYQQNFLKHQMNEAAANSGKKKYSHKQQNHENTNKSEQNDATTHQKSPSSTTTPTTSRSSDKTDLEIIVNNPDYEIKSPRPGSARHRLLQDLKHTEISNIVNNDGVMERNRRNAELEMAKKKDYQRELMAQIEEHRRSIALLKEKERRQDEAMTRKLEEQLTTMRLQEELEKEKMRADRMRFDSEQKRLMREHLLNKLETDTKALDASVRKTHSELSKISPAKNKVYKYFSNSARHEFRRDSPHDRQHDQPAFHVDLPQSTRRHPTKCFHVNDNDSNSNVCPFCNSPLKSYESWCLKCEKRIFGSNSRGGEETESLVCANCKNLFATCLNCDDQGEEATTHSQRKQTSCSGCRKTLCSECMDGIAVVGKHKADSERSFEILEVNYPDEQDDEAANDLNNNPERHHRPPYSMNIDRNSIFHQDFDRSKVYNNEEESIDEMRHQTEKQLSRYLKNYGDLACKGLRDRSTQTTPDSAARRDIVMVEENNLSMPLLREMPRMTRKESNFQQAERKKIGTRIENLARRWEVPAVQKHTITTSSPKVLTQLGAIRKQLQSEQLHLDF